MTIKPRTDARAIVTPTSQAKAPWAATTVLASAVAAALPFNHALPSAPRALWFACVVALIGIPIIYMRTGRLPLWPAVWVFAGYASLVSIITATKAATIDGNLFVGAQLVLFVGFGPFAMTANALADRKFVQRVSVAFLVGESLSAIVAILQLLGQPVLGPEPLYGRAFGLSEHPNTLGLMSCMATLIAIQFLLATRRFRLWALAGLAANITALVASGSVSAMMALAIGFAVQMVCNRDYLGKMALWGSACAFALWLVGKFSGVFNYLPSVTGRLDQVTGQTESVSSWGLRILTYKFAWSRISEEPIFGVGLGAKFSGTYNGVTITHNLFLRAWYQGGILLAIAFAFIVIAVTIVVLRAMVEKENGGEASILMAIFTVAMTSTLFEQRHFWLPVLVAWGSISAAAIKKRELPAGTTADANPRFTKPASDPISTAFGLPDRSPDRRHSGQHSFIHDQSL